MVLKRTSEEYDAQITQKYRRMDHRVHILEYPDSYIGSVTSLSRRDWVVEDDGNWVPTISEVTVAPGLIKCFEEVITNAFDNCIRARKLGQHVPAVHIVIDGWKVTVRNGGPEIPIIIHPEEGVYIPELIFGTLLTSSTYDDTERLTAGRNGYGGKLTNRFSQYFSVVVVDGERGLRFEKTWCNNMDTEDAAVITTVPDGSQNLVEISFIIDAVRFGLDPGKEGLPNDAITLIRRIVYDHCFTSQAMVTLNSKTVPKVTMQEYARTLFGSLPSMYYRSTALSDIGFPLIEFTAKSAEGGGVVSFVNGIRTIEGGVHVDVVWKRLHKAVGGMWKGVTLRDLQQQVALVIVICIAGPTFRGQMKEYFTGPDIAVKKFSRSDLGELVTCARLHSALMRRRKEKIPSVPQARGTGPRKESDLRELQDAAYAGTARSKDCTLVIIEGRAGKDYAETMVGGLPGGRDVYGIMDDNGVIINSYEDTERMRNGKDYMRMQKALGNESHRRYSRIILLSDQDEDGVHINSLKICMIYRYFKHFITEGRLFVCLTPLIRVGKLTFYNQESYKKWTETNPRHTARYMKGLGSSTRTDVVEDLKRLKLVQLTEDEDTAETLAMMFSGDSGYMAKRKAFVREAHIHPLPAIDVDVSPCTITRYMTVEYARHCVYSNVRNIPSLDGCKLAQRKVLWTCWNRWAPKHNPERGITTGKTYKVAQLAARVAEVMGYHHGERNLDGVIINMASKYCNNRPLLEPAGAFGTMEDGVSGASPGRYIFTRPTHDMQMLLPKEDVPLLKYTPVENVNCEPDILLPIAPLALINGSRGIGTGVKTFIPPHNPRQVCQWFVDRLQNNPTRMPLPYYINFTGPLKVVRNKRRKILEGVEYSDETLQECPHRLMETEAVWCVEHINKDETKVDIIIREFPPEVTLGEYKRKLDKWVEEGVIDDYRDLSRIVGVIDVICVLVRGIRFRACFEPGDRLYHRVPQTIGDIPYCFGLRRFHSLDHFNYLDLDNHLHHAKTVSDYCEAFYAFRLPYYNKRAALLVEQMEKDTHELIMRKKFIEAVLTGNIQLLASEADIKQRLQSMNIAEEIYNNTKTRALNEESVRNLREQVEKLVELVESQRKITGVTLWLADLNNFLASIPVS